jgi:hypothetical protein
VPGIGSVRGELLTDDDGTPSGGEGCSSIEVGWCER